MQYKIQISHQTPQASNMVRMRMGNHQIHCPHSAKQTLLLQLREHILSAINQKQLIIIDEIRCRIPLFYVKCRASAQKF